MKNPKTLLLSLLLIATIALPVLAGRLANRERATTAAASGLILVEDVVPTWTTAELRRVWIVDAAVNTVTGTLSRVYSLGGTTYTQQVDTVISASKLGDSVPTSIAQLLPGDDILITTSPATNAVFILDLDILRP